MVYHAFLIIVYLLPVKLRIQLRDLRETTSYRANESEAALMFSHTNQCFLAS